MSLLALSAPTAYLGGILGTAYALASGTAVAPNSGVTCPWAPGLMIVIVSGGTAAGVCTLYSASFTGPSITVAITTGFGIFGPIPQIYANASNLVQVNVTTNATATAFAALLPFANTIATHCPIEQVP